MKRAFPAAWLCLALAVLCTRDAGAEITGDGSLEWFTDTSPMIGVYSVVTVKKKIADHRAHYDFTLRLEEAVKGQPPAGLPSEYWATVDEIKDGPEVEKGSRFLLFMKADETAKLRIDRQVWLLRAPRLPWRGSWILDARFQPLGDEAVILRRTFERKNANGRAVPRYYGERSAAVVEAPRGAGGGLVGVFDGFLLEVPEDLKNETLAARDLLELKHALESYKLVNRAFPANNGNAAIVAELMKRRGPGGSEVYFIGKRPELNAAGEFLDPWGTPYRFDTSNPQFAWVYSFGPDKKDGGGAAVSDDIASWDSR